MFDFLRSKPKDNQTMAKKSDPATGMYQDENDLTFMASGTEVLRFRPDGTILVNGAMMTRDQDLVDGLTAVLKAAQGK